MDKVKVKSKILTPAQLALAQEDVNTLLKTERIVGIIHIISETYAPAKFSYEDGEYVMTVGNY